VSCIIVSYKSSNLIVFIGSVSFVAFSVLFVTDRGCDIAYCVP